jgi:thiol-disulfide isomerase/thioredoxin
MKHPDQYTRRRWIGFALAANAGRLALPAQATKPNSAIDWPALVDIEGRAIAADSWRGVSAVIVFWATWCPYCKRHNRHIDALFRSVDGNQLRVMGVVLDADASAARQYMKTQGYRFPVVTDDGRLRSRFTERRVIPMTCTVNADGHLLQCIPGEMAHDDVMGLARLA